jgi:hypothetical protein
MEIHTVIMENYEANNRAVVLLAVANRLNSTIRRASHQSPGRVFSM